MFDETDDLLLVENTLNDMLAGVSEEIGSYKTTEIDDIITVSNDNWLGNLTLKRRGKVVHMTGSLSTKPLEVKNIDSNVTVITNPGLLPSKEIKFAIPRLFFVAATGIYRGYQAILMLSISSSGVVHAQSFGGPGTAVYGYNEPKISVTWMVD